MRTTTFSAAVALLLLVSFAAKAQFDPVPSPHKRTSVDGLKRHLYEQTSLLPDELALESLLTTMRFAGRAAPEDKQIRVEQIQKRMGIQQGQARAFLQYLIRMDRDYNKDVERLHTKMACSPEQPRKAGDEIYFLFEAMYAAERASLTEHLAIIASHLTKEQWTRFDDWLEDIKLETTYWTEHHKEAYEAAGASPDAKLNDICNYLMTVTQ